MSGKIDEIEDTKKEDSKASDPKMDGAGAKDPKLGSTAKGNQEPADKGNSPPSAAHGTNDPEQGKNLKEKRMHSCGDGCSFFPMFHTMFILRLVLGVISCVLGSFLLIVGNWSNSAEIGLTMLTEGRTFPADNLEIEDPEYHRTVLLMAMWSGYIFGALFLVFGVYVLWTALVLYKLEFSKFPWTRALWGAVRITANNFLVDSGIRDESIAEQYARLNSKQQEDLAKFDSVASRGQVSPSGQDASSKDANPEPKNA